MSRIYTILRYLSVTKAYLGCHQTAYAVKLALENEDRLSAVTKEIYMETASHFGCSWGAIERNIRTVIVRAWRICPERLIELAGYPLDGAPTEGEFIEILVNYMRQASPVVRL